MEQIDSGVDIAVMVRTTVPACPESVGQRDIVVDATAGATCFRGRIEAIRQQNLRPVPVGFVLAETTEHAPSAVRDALGELVVLEHARYVQVFYTYDAVLGDESVRQLMQEIGSLAGDMFMSPGDQQTCFVAIGASFLLARQTLLEFFQPSLGVFQTLGMLDLFARRQDGEVFESKVDAYGRLAVGSSRHIHFAENRCVILATLGFRDGETLRFPFQRTVENDFHPTDFRQIDAVAVELEPLGVADGLTAVTLLESRVSGPLLEIVGKGAVQILDLRLQCLTIRFPEPCVVGLAFQFRHHALEGIVAHVRVMFAVIRIARRQRPVVHETGMTELDSQSGLLLPIGVQAIAKRFAEHQIPL